MIPSTLESHSNLELSESFYASFDRILFHTRVLDDSKAAHAFRSCDPRKQDGVVGLWHDYLLFRSRDQQDESVACYVEKQSIGDTLVQCGQADFDAILDRICWLAMEGGEYCDGGWQGWNGFRPGPRNLGASTLSAATYLGYTPLVKNLLRQGYDPTHGDYIFSSAFVRCCPNRPGRYAPSLSRAPTPVRTLQPTS